MTLALFGSCLADGLLKGASISTLGYARIGIRDNHNLRALLLWRLRRSLQDGQYYKPLLNYAGWLAWYCRLTTCRFYTVADSRAAGFCSWAGGRHPHRASAGLKAREFTPEERHHRVSPLSREGQNAGHRRVDGLKNLFNINVLN